MTKDIPRYGGGSWMHGPEANADSRRRRRLLTSLVVAAAAFPVVWLLFWGVVVRSCACTPLPPTPPPSPVEGIVVAVDAASLTEVRSFTLRASSGATIEFRLGPLENATEFSPSHLAEHMAAAEPIRAFYRLDAGRPVVYRLEDADANPVP